MRPAVARALRVALPLLAGLWSACGQPPAPIAGTPAALPGPSSGVIEGQILLPDADSGAGTLIYCAGTNHVAFTDAAGHYAFSDIPFGAYDLTARREGYIEQPLGAVQISAQSPRATLRPVTLARTPLEVMELPPPARGNLSGRATRADTGESAGIVVALAGTSLRTVTDEGGHWLLHEIDPGRYTLRFSADGFQSTAVSASVEPGRLTELAPVVLQPEPGAAATSPRGIRGFVALLGPSGELQDDYSGVQVIIQGTDRTAVPDADGYFEFRDLDPAVYRLSARAPGYRPGEPLSVDLRQTPWQEATLFLESAALARPQLGTITGTASLSDGASPMGVTVGIPGTSLTAVTGGDGRFTLERVPVGTVSLIAQANGYDVLEVPDIAVAAGQTTNAGSLLLQVHREPPRVIASDPRDGERDVLVEPQIPVFLRFSVDMDIASVKQAITLDPPVSYTAYMGREHPETDDDLLLIMLQGGVSGVSYRNRVHITVGTGAKNAEGIAMQAPFDLRFAMGRPSLYSSTPKDGEENFPYNQPIALRFNAPLRAQEIDTAFSFSPNPPTLPQVQVSRDPATGWTTIFVSTVLSPDQRYTLRISRNIRTDTGQSLGGRREIRFRTAPQVVIDYQGQPAPRDDSVIY